MAKKTSYQIDPNDRYQTHANSYDDFIYELEDKKEKTRRRREKESEFRRRREEDDDDFEYGD